MSDRMVGRTVQINKISLHDFESPPLKFSRHDDLLLTGYLAPLVNQAQIEGLESVDGP